MPLHPLSAEVAGAVWCGFYSGGFCFLPVENWVPGLTQMRQRLFHWKLSRAPYFPLPHLHWGSSTYTLLRSCLVWDHGLALSNQGWLWTPWSSSSQVLRCEPLSPATTLEIKEYFSHSPFGYLRVKWNVLEWKLKAIQSWTWRSHQITARALTLSCTRKAQQTLCPP